MDLKTAHPSNQQKTFLEPDTELLKKGIIRLAALKYDLPLNEHLGVTKRPLLIFFCFSFFAFEGQCKLSFYTKTVIVFNPKILFDDGLLASATMLEKVEKRND